MGYLHINNLYKDKTIIQLFKECYALEKIHGTSAHIRWKDGQLSYFHGGATKELFVKLFDEQELIDKFTEIGCDDVVVYGEAYGGKMQGMRDTYGDQLRFIVFDVKMAGKWLRVPQAEKIATQLNQEFTDYERITTDMDSIDAERDRPSSIAAKLGLGVKKREGVVLRPIVELQLNNGKRIIAKHKRDDFSETRTPRVVSEEDLKVLSDANEIAIEWVTPMRLTHVLDKIGQKVTGGPMSMVHTKLVIEAMWEDIEREAVGEVVLGRATRTAIGRETAKIFKARLQESLRE